VQKKLECSSRIGEVNVQQIFELQMLMNNSRSSAYEFGDIVSATSSATRAWRASEGLTSGL